MSKVPLTSSELPKVDGPSAPINFGPQVGMEHLVVDNKFQKIPRHPFTVEYGVDADQIIAAAVTPEGPSPRCALRPFCPPRDRRGDLSVKIFPIDRIIEIEEIVIPTLRPER